MITGALPAAVVAGGLKKRGEKVARRPKAILDDHVSFNTATNHLQLEPTQKISR